MTSIFKRKGRKGYALKYRDPSTHRERTRQFHTKTDAQMYGDRIRAALLAVDGLEVDVRFDQHAKQWLAATELAVRKGSATMYRWALTRYLIPAFGEQYLRDLTPKMMRDLIVTLRAKLSKNTVKNIRTVLHACLQAAVEERILHANPASFRSRSKLMGLERGSEQRGKVKAFTAEQVAAFFAAAPVAAPRHHLLFLVMALTGLRPGEAIGLKPRDLDLTAGTIRLERAVTQGRIEPCKTDAEGQFQIVDMPAGLAPALETWVVGRPADAWLFPGRWGAPCHQRGAVKAFGRILASAGLPLHFTPHCLRHTYATQQLIAGESVYYVSRQLRHTDIRMTVRTYGSWLPAGNRAAADRLYERLFSVP